MTLRRQMKTTRRLTNYKFISRLPRRLMYEIMNRMTVKDLVRMRRTCKFSNSVAEEYKTKLSCRPALGTDLVIEFKQKDYSKRQRSCEELHFSSSFDGQSTKLVEGDFEKRIAGISFKLIYVNIERSEPYLQLLKIFERIQPVCEKFYLKNCPLHLFVPLTNSVTFINDFNQIDFQEYLKTTSMDSILATLKTAKNRSKFSISISGFDKITEGIFEKMICFSQVNLATTIPGFRELLLDLHNSTEKIMMKKLVLHFGEQEVFLSLSSLSFVQCLRRPKCSRMDAEGAWDIRLISLPSQFVVIEEYVPWPFDSEHSKHILSFIDKTAKALEEKLTAIHIKSDYDKFAAEVDDNEVEGLQEDENNKKGSCNPNDNKDYDPDEHETDPRKQYTIFKRDVRFIVSSIFQNVE